MNDSASNVIELPSIAGGAERVAAVKTCSFNGCGYPGWTVGLCDAHYRQKRLGKELVPVKKRKGKRKAPSPCSFLNCSNVSRGTGLCVAHCAQRRKGKELSPIAYAWNTHNQPLCVACRDPNKPKSDEFFWRAKTRKGFKSRCKECYRLETKAPGEKEKRREYHLRRMYGVTGDWYRQQLVTQDGKCAICRSADPGRGSNNYFCVDHDHATGKVRQLLCVACNSGIGQFFDSIDRMKSAIAYLERHGK